MYVYLSLFLCNSTIICVDNMKPDMIAKLCLQCSDFYADTMQVMQKDTVRNIWPKVRLQIFSVNLRDLFHNFLPIYFITYFKFLFDYKYPYTKRINHFQCTSIFPNSQ